MSSTSAHRNPVSEYLLHLLLPVLVGIFPAVFHYANNSDIALPSSFLRLLGLFAGIAVVLYAVLLVVMHGRSLLAAIAATVILLFFHTYGLAANALRALDAFRVEHYTLLPLFLLLAFELAWPVRRLSAEASAQAWRAGVMIFGALLAVNAAKIAYVEIRTTPTPTVAKAIAAPNPSANQDYPDIYYFIYDEMAGFEAVRQYWGYSGVNSLVASLRSKGFYVAEKSHGIYPETLYEIAQRLNYEAFPPYEPNKKGHYQEDAANGRGLEYLKSLGYTTVGFDENRSPFGFPAGPPIHTDILYEEAPQDTPTQGVGTWDGFSLLVLDNTMLQPLVAGIKLSTPMIDAEHHREMISFTMNKISHLEEIPAPRFVYVHLLLPHVPHMFKADGSLGPTSGQYDWNNYLDNYKFTMSVMEHSVEDILAASDPARPPVIIIQSDHGARNTDFGLGTMPDYPDEYKTLIVDPGPLRTHKNQPADSAAGRSSWSSLSMPWPLGSVGASRSPAAPPLSSARTRRRRTHALQEMSRRVFVSNPSSAGSLEDPLPARRNMDCHHLGLLDLVCHTCTRHI